MRLSPPLRNLLDARWTLSGARDRYIPNAAGREKVVVSPSNQVAAKRAHLGFGAMAEPTQTVEDRLEEIGTQLAWVRDYL